MKKLTAMLLSLMMCLSLMAIPAQAAFTLDPDGPGIIDVGGKKDPTDPGDDGLDKPGNTVDPMGWPEPRDNTPTGGNT